MSNEAPFDRPRIRPRDPEPSPSTEDSLEQRCVAALTDDNAKFEQLADLVIEVEDGISAATADAAKIKEEALDPLIYLDANAARAAVENAAFRVTRLSALLPRLQGRLAIVHTQETLAQWHTDYAPLKAERDALAAELREVYPAAVATLTNLFARITANDAEISQLHRRRPAGVSLNLDGGAECAARQLKAFTRDRQPLLQLVQLFDFDSGEQVWPPRRTTIDPMLFAPPVFDRRYSADWAAARDDNAAAAQAEQDRVANFYKEQGQRQLERQAREQREAEQARR